jgi:hypothetical protein
MTITYTIAGDAVVVTVRPPDAGHAVAFMSPRCMRTWLGSGTQWVVVEADAGNYTDAWEVNEPL